LYYSNQLKLKKKKYRVKNKAKHQQSQLAENSDRLAKSFEDNRELRRAEHAESQIRILKK